MLRKNSNLLMIFIAAAIVSIGFLVTDIYLPSMPAMAKNFKTSDDLVQLSITVNLISAAFFGLFSGPLSDRFGRKPLLLFAISMILITSIICALSTNIEIFLAARLLQGFGVGSASVVGLLIPRDLYSSKKATQYLSIMGLLMISAPAIAPLIGGEIQLLFGWRMNFVFVSFLCCILIFLILFYFRETLPKERRLAARFREVFRNYLKMITDNNFVSYASITPLLFAAELCYFTILPFYFIDHLNIAPNVFGLYLFIIVSAYLLGSLIMPYLINRFEPDKLIMSGIFFSLISCGVLIFFAYYFPTNILLISIPLAAHQLSMALIFSPALTKILDLFSQNKGSVSALRNTFLTLGAALGSLFGSILSEDTLIGMSIFMFVTSCIAWWIFQKKT